MYWLVGESTFSFMADNSQQFLRDLDKKLWTAADRLRANLDAAVYKHAVLGLIFLKYISDSFTARQKEIEAELRNSQSDYFLDPADHGGADSPNYAEAIRDELEERDYYIEKNVFWVPALARWKTLQDSAKLPPGTEIEITNGKKSTYKISSTGRLIDDALDAIERENPKLKGVLNKTYTQLQLDPANLSSLVDLIATIPFEHADLNAKDILGHVYEYFLTRRASDQARCIVRAGGLREIDAGGPRLVRKFRLVVHATPLAFGKEWCPVGAA